MEFGVLGLDAFAETTTTSSNGEAENTVVGSVLAKREKPIDSAQEEWKSLKIPRSDDFLVPRAMALHQNGSDSLLRSNSMLDSRQNQHMLSFSSLKPQITSFLSKDGVFIDKNAEYYHQNPSTYVAGYGGGNINGGLHGAFSGVRGPFTPSQWMELEHQALIYKYLTAKVPVPSNLLIPIKKSLYPYGLPASSAGPFPPNTLGWSTFHLGYPGNTTDPEPGRCRRTDGKKWRCSRDAVADQKYCERHINRGRHRSRKPVEGHTGHAAAGTTNSKGVPMTTSVSTSVITSGAASNSLAITPQQFKNVQPAAVSSFSIVNRAQDPRELSLVSSSVNLKPEDSTFRMPKQDIPIDEPSQLEFGLVPSDSLLNPSERTAYLSAKNYESFLNFGDQESQEQHSLRQYTDDWPKDQSNRSVVCWPDELKSDWTQLSMSIPMTSPEFSSSTSSPTREKFALSPLRLSCEFDTSHMGAGVHNNPSEFSHKQANWIPISWGNSMGGPLGEVLTTSAGNADCKNTSSLSLSTHAWDGSPQLGSSPTGVLQKAAFGSLSNSSSGSSPRAA